MCSGEHIFTFVRGVRRSWCALLHSLNKPPGSINDLEGFMVMQVTSRGVRWQLHCCFLSHLSAVLVCGCGMQVEP